MFRSSEANGMAWVALIFALAGAITWVAVHPGGGKAGKPTQTEAKEEKKEFKSNMTYDVLGVLSDGDVKIFKETNDITKIKDSKVYYVGKPIETKYINYNDSEAVRAEAVTTDKNIIFRISPGQLDYNSKTELYKIHNHDVIFICDVLSDTCITQII
jgi:hypothetical protein